ERPVAICVTTVSIEGPDRGTIEPRGRILRLIALPLKPLAERPTHVPALAATVEACHLAIDKVHDTCFACTGAGFIRGDQAGSNRIDASSLCLREEALVRIGGGRIGFAGYPGHVARDRPCKGRRH